MALASFDERRDSAFELLDRAFELLDRAMGAFAVVLRQVGGFIPGSLEGAGFLLGAKRAKVSWFHAFAWLRVPGSLLGGLLRVWHGE